MSEPQNREHWGTKIGFVLAAAGSAVGLGNIWKFPYVTGQYGGAAFIIIYIVCVLILGFPIMIAELVIGRHTEKDPVGAFKKMMGGTIWGYVGYIGVFCGFVILSYYSVVGGWTLGYIIKSFQGLVTASPDVEAAGKLFGKFIGNPVETIIYHFIFISITALIVIRGIKKGIERWSKVLMPLLLILLFVLIIKGLSMEGAMKGVAFLFNPDFSKITVEAVIAALGHSFFTLSLGMGAMITYGSYLNKTDDVLKSGAYIVTLDTVIALLAGMAMFPALFAMGMTPVQGPGLIFNIVPAVFGKMQYGLPFSIVFFTLILIAALTSAISILEVVVAYIIDEKGWARKKAVLVFGFIIFLVGVPSALSFGVMGDVKIFFGQTFFDFMDKLATNYLLPIGGFLITLCLGWKYGIKNAYPELDDDTKNKAVKKAWAFTLKYITPVILFVFIIILLKDDVAGFFAGLFS